jgi:hypothetical protein
MDDLIEALQLIATRSKPIHPLHCEHDRLTVCVDSQIFTVDEIAHLETLGFFVDDLEKCFYSFRFGSA